jgi:hypothetical protein
MQGSCAGGIARMFGGTEAAENRTLRERVRALEQQLASAATATAPVMSTPWAAAHREQQVLTQEAPLAAAAGTMQYDGEQWSPQANPGSPVNEDSDYDSPPLIESDDEEESEKDSLTEAVKAEDTTPTRAEGHEVAVFEMDPTTSEQAEINFKMRLGLRIAAGPEAFFALADTKQDDILSPRGWLEACKSSLGNVDTALCLSL